MNPTTVHYLNLFLGSGAILLQISSAVVLFLLFFGHRQNRKNMVLDFISTHFLAIGFLVSLFASLFSLVYSEVINFAPCYLCWFQRIFIFPLVFLFGIAFWDQDRKIIKYVLPMLSLGFVISMYQNFFYYFAAGSALPCDASGVSCYQRLISEFGGYISIPMLALTSFVAILTVVLVAHFYKKAD